MPTETENGMRDRWHRLWSQFGARTSPDRVYAMLSRYYAESHRRYHTLEHIRHCLKEYDRVSHTAEQPNALELALWFHDAVYDTFASDNEERSAELAAQTLRQAGLSDSVVTATADLIRATDHASVLRTFDGQLIHDIDLAILGKPEEQFDRYEQQIRQEYCWVPRQRFTRRRAEILHSFLDRKSVYATPLFVATHEEQARHNLRRALEHLA